MREQNEKVINLPEDDPEIFSIMVEWLYTKSISRDSDELNYTTDAYVAADKYGMQDLQNALMDRLRAKLDKGFKAHKIASPDWVSDVWRDTMDGSKLRKLGLDYLHYCLVTKLDAYQPRSDKVQALPLQMRKFMDDGELGHALVLRFAEQGDLTIQSPMGVVGCVYHVHENGKKCGE